MVKGLFTWKQGNLLETTAFILKKYSLGNGSVMVKEETFFLLLM